MINLSTSNNKAAYIEEMVIRSWGIGLISLFTFLLLPLYIHFTSPLIEKLNPESLIKLEESFSEVVVFITIDGLLWDSIKMDTTPFLFSQITQGARHGYTFVKAPTESRPCHIALLAGFYEDPSSLWRLWRENGKPEFDSVFSYSNSLAVGGPDVVPFFTKGASDTYRTVTFPLDWYKSKTDVRELDTFVLNELKSSYKDEPLVFCHLATVDTAGHRFGSHSPEYQQGILHADSIIQSIVNQFKDKKASFIVTSDHGFAPNSHGHDLDHPYTKKTPLLLFGHLLGRVNSQDAPELPSGDWEHVNVASLISALLQTQLPSNYVGDLRALDVLQLSDEKTRAMLAIQQTKIINMKLEQLTSHHFGFIAYKYRNTAAFYKNTLDQLVEALFRQPQSASTVYKMVKDAGQDIQRKSKRFQNRLQVPAILLFLISALNIFPFPLPVNTQVAAALLLLVVFIVQSVTPTLYLLAIIFLLPFLKPAEKIFKWDNSLGILQNLLMEVGSIGVLFTPYALFFHMMAVVLIQKKAVAKPAEYFLSILSTFVALVPSLYSKWLLIPLIILFLWHKKVASVQIVPMAALQLLKFLIQKRFELWLDIIVSATVLLARLWFGDAKSLPAYLPFFIINDPRTLSAMMLTLLIDRSYWESLWLSAFFPQGVEGYLKPSSLRHQVFQILLTALCLPFNNPMNLLTSFFPLFTFMSISTEDQQWKTMGVALIRQAITSFYSVFICLLYSYINLRVLKPSTKYILV